MSMLRKKLSDGARIAKGNWYYDRYQSSVVQRNFFVLITLASLVLILFSVFTILKINTTRSIEPFIIEIEPKSGITTVVRPYKTQRKEFNASLREYFVNQYVQARETYSIHTYKKNYYDVIHILSSKEVYADFNSTWPSQLGKNGNVTVDISFLTERPTPKGMKGYIYQVRFDQKVKNKSSTTLHKKLATITFTLNDLKMKPNQKAINPIGFQVIDYRIEDDTLQKSK